MIYRSLYVLEEQATNGKWLHIFTTPSKDQAKKVAKAASKYRRVAWFKRVKVVK